MCMCTFSNFLHNTQTTLKYFPFTAKKHVILTIAFVTMPELQLLTRLRIVPCGSQLWAVKHTWSTGKAEVATRDAKFAKASDKCYTQQKGIVS